ncbi:hypothetical protein SLS62_009833 [Diatrype stigma]|uniref:S-adenosyl-L-methionine-dependent methyltransferase n=1 Tax=Diatrype stigma TaxID=117547 RepID=A0AAN9YJH0_9PEZI
MPRLPPSLLRRAYRISPHLATLLPACRDLASARNELRWILFHSEASSPAGARGVKEVGLEARIAHLCEQRGRRGIPLQYVLGSQPFGPLDIECRPGILIPRPETEAWVYGVADLIAGSPSLFSSSSSSSKATATPLRIVDFCTGTGCVALLLSSLLQKRQQHHGRLARSRIVHGFDVDERAVALARQNLAANVRRGCLPPQKQPSLFPSSSSPTSPEGPDHRHDDHSAIFFEKGNVFSEDWHKFLRRAGGRRDGASSDPIERKERAEEEERIDVLVANPPYISTHGFDHDTGRSVRNHEPKLALVPDPTLLKDDGSGSPRPKDEDVFYARLLQIAEQMRPEVIVFEVGDLAQAVRVVGMALSGMQKRGEWNSGVEIWRDWPDEVPGEDEAQAVEVSGINVPIKGSGNGRVVVLRRNVDGTKN